MCERIGALGAPLVPGGATVGDDLQRRRARHRRHRHARSRRSTTCTVCGRGPRVVVPETRPLLQGSRLTAWELSRAGVRVHRHRRRHDREPAPPGRRRLRAGGRRPHRRQRRRRQQDRHLRRWRSPRRRTAFRSTSSPRPRRSIPRCPTAPRSRSSCARADEVTALARRARRGRRRGRLESRLRRHPGRAGDRDRHRPRRACRPARSPASWTDALDPRARPGHDRLHRARHPPGRLGARPRLSRVHPVLPAARLGRARSGGDLPGLARGHAPRRWPAAGERPVGLGITNQRETVVLWDRRTLRAGRARHRLAGPAHQRAMPRAAGSRASRAVLRARTGLVADPYFSATKLEWLLRDPALRRRAASGRARGGHGGELAGRAAHRRPGPRERPHQRQPHAALRSRAAATGIPSCSASSAFRASCCPPSCPRPASSARPIRSTSASRCRSPGSPATSSRRSSGRGAAPTGWRRTPTAPARSCWCYRGDRLPQPPDGVLATAACGPRGEPAYALEGSVFIAGAAVQWLRDGLGIIGTRAGDRRAGPERAGHGRRIVRARVRRAGHAALGAGGAGHHHRAHPGHHAGAPGARRARGDRVQQRRAAARRWRRRTGVEVPALRVDGGARGERLDDAVPGRHAGHPGGAARHGGDDGARRRGAGRPRARRLADHRRSSWPAAGSPGSSRG